MFQCAWYEVCTDNSDIISGHILKEIIDITCPYYDFIHCFQNNVLLGQC